MTRNHIGVIRRKYESHGSTLMIKDDEGQKQEVLKSDVFYFMYIEDEIKSKAGATAAVAVEIKNFDKYQT